MADLALKNTPKEEVSSITDRSLFSLSWPIFIDLFLHQATILINIAMVSHLSTHFVAAMNVGNHLFQLCITIFSFISVGCSVVIAQYLGAGRPETARKTLHISIALNGLLGLFVAIVIFLFGWQSLELMNTPQSLMEDAYNYLHILGICLIFEAISLILAASLRVYGKTKAVMYVSLIVNLLTIFGNMLLLYGFFGLPQLGLVGVAWSTAIGRFIGGILLFYLLFSGLKISFEWSLLLKWSKKQIGQILKIGLPAAGENMVWFLHYLTALAFIGLLGEKSLAAESIYFALASFIMLVGASISIANEIIVAHFVGAKAYDRALQQGQKALKFGFLLSLIVAVTSWLLSPWIMGLLTDDQAVIEIMAPLFLLGILLEPGRSLNIVMVNSLRATGDAAFPLKTAFLFMWGISIPLGYFLGIKLEYGLLGIWLGFCADEWVRGLTNSWRWYSRKWEAKGLALDDE